MSEAADGIGVVLDGVFRLYGICRYHKTTVESVLVEELWSNQTYLVPSLDFKQALDVKINLAASEKKRKFYVIIRDNVFSGREIVVDHEKCEWYKPRSSFADPIEASLNEVYEHGVEYVMNMDDEGSEDRPVLEV